MSVVYLFFAYFKLYADMPTNSKPLNASSLDQEDVEGVIIYEPISSPSHVGGNKYGPLLQQPSPENRGRRSKGIVRRAKSGGHISSTVTSNPEKIRDSEATPAQISNSGPVQPRTSPKSKGMRLSKSMG